MTRDTIRSLIAGLFRNYRPDLPTEEGSAFDTEFLSPLVEYLAVDTDTSDVFVLDRLEQAFPDVDFRSTGGAFVDVLRKVPGALLDSLLQTVQMMRLERAGLANPIMLTADSANDLAGNFFIHRVEAGYSTVVVRMYFNSLTRTVVFLENVARTATGLGFRPAASAAISPETLQRDGSLYFVDMLFVAEGAGPEYHIDAKSIITVEGVAGLVRATNLAQSSRVTADETPESLADRVLDSITDRSQVVKRGIKTAVAEGVAAVADVEVVGFNDPEMFRDVLGAEVTQSSDSKPSKPVAAGSGGAVGLLYSGTALDNCPVSNRYSLAAEVQLTPGKAAWVTIIDATPVIDRGIVEVTDSGHWLTLDDFTVVQARVMQVSPSPVGEEGAAIIQSPWVRMATPVLEGHGLALPRDVLVLWDSGHPAFTGFYQLAAAEGDRVFVDCDYITPVVGDTGVVVARAGSLWLRVPAVVELHTGQGGVSTTCLTIECNDDGEQPLWLEFSGTNSVKSVEPSPGLPGYTDIRLPIKFAWGFFTGVNSVSEDMSWAAGETISEGDEFKWTYWSCDVSKLPPVAPQRGIVTTYKGLIIRTRLEVDQLLRPLGTTLRNWVIREENELVGNSVLTIGRQPGGITFMGVNTTPDSPQGVLVVPPDEVHIGGKVDVYSAARAGYSDAVGYVADIRDNTPLVQGGDLRVSVDSELVYSSKFDVSTVNEVNFRCAALSKYNEPIYEAFRITGAQGHHLELDETSATESLSERFYVSSPYVSYGLTYPRVIKVAGNNLQSYIHSRTVTTTEDVDQVEVGDILRILEPNRNMGEYPIQAIQVSTMSLIIDKPLPVAATDQKFEVIRRGDTFRLPIIDIKSASLVDDGGEVGIPAGKPIGAMAHRDFVDGKGNVRVYFLDPTFFYARGAVFESHGRRYKGTGKYPLYISDANNTGITCVSGENVVRVPESSLRTSLLSNKAFLNTGTVTLRAEYRTLTRTGVTETVAVKGKTLRMRVGDNSPMRTLTFLGSAAEIPMDDTFGTFGGVIQQINSFFPGVTAKYADLQLHLISSDSITIGEGTANAALQLVNNLTNKSVNRGKELTVVGVAQMGVPFAGTELQLDNDVFDETGTVFALEDDGPIVFPAAMLYDPDNQLFYTDVLVEEVPTDGVGTNRNVERGDQMTIVLPEGAVYYGHHLTTDNPTLTYSVAEQLTLKLSAWFFDIFAYDICGTKYVTPNQRLRIEYRYCPVTGAVQYLLAGGDSRIVNSDPLARAALPTRVVGTIAYSGGDSADTMITPMHEFVQNTRLGDYIDISDIRAVLRKRGATGFVDPTSLMLVSQDVNRQYSVAKLVDRYQAARVEKLVPDTGRLSAVQVVE